MRYFGEPVGRVKIQTTSKNSQRYYTTKRLIRDLLSNTSKFYVRVGEFRGICLRECVTEVCEAELNWRRKSPTGWSTANNLSNRSSGVQIPCHICTRFGPYLYSTRCSWIIIIIFNLRLTSKFFFSFLLL